MNQLDNDKQAYIEYIKAVCETCGLPDVSDTIDDLKKLSLRELDELSIQAERTYNSHLRNKTADKVVEDIEKYGAEYVKAMYGLQ